MVMKMMLETAKVKCDEAMDCLDKIRKKLKYLDQMIHKLLDQALPSKAITQKRKSEGEKNWMKSSKDYH